MCLIVVSPNGALFPRDKFMRSASMNNDGFGIMWADEGRVKNFKMMGKPYEWYAYYDMMKAIPHAFHHRMATHGSESLANVHPFRVLSKDHHGKDLFVMHNGVITGTSAV